MTESNHRQAMLEALSCYLDREMETGCRKQLEEHLTKCEQCRQDLESLDMTVRFVRSLPPAQLPRYFTIQTPSSTYRPWRWLSSIWRVPVAAAAPVVAILFVAAIVWEGLFPQGVPDAAIPVHQAQEFDSSTERITQPAATTSDVSVQLASPSIRSEKPAPTPNVAPNRVDVSNAQNDRLLPTQAIIASMTVFNVALLLFLVLWSIRHRT